MVGEKRFLARIVLDPIDAKYLLQNLGRNLLYFHNLIEEENLKVKVDVEKSKDSFEILLVLLAIPPAIESVLNLWEKLKREWRKREKIAKKEYRKFKIIELKD
jgi:hypothetical protein